MWWVGWRASGGNTMSPVLTRPRQQRARKIHLTPVLFHSAAAALRRATHCTADPGNNLARHLRRLQPGSNDWIVSVSAGAARGGAVASIKYFLFSPERKRSKFPCARLMTVPQHWLCWLGHNCTRRHHAYPGPAAALNTDRVCNSLSATRADQ